MTDEVEGGASAPAVPLEPLRALDPRELGGWRMLGRLGTGGMGVAFLAERDGQWAVVKMIRTDLAEDRHHRARIARELEAMRLAAGPHTAALYDSDLDGDPAWFAMEFIPGMTLTRHIEEQGPLEGSELKDFATRLADVLVAVHGAGVVHRDLKPSNIMLSPDGPRLIDFGIADLTEGTQLTRTGAVLGSTGWLAPEQVTGDPVTAATDIHAWSLCVLYAAVGQPPFGGDTASASLYRVLEFTPDVPELVPEPLRGLAQAALAKDPTRRPTLDRITAVLTPPPPAPPRAPEPPPPPPPPAPAPPTAAIPLTDQWTEESTPAPTSTMATARPAPAPPQRSSRRVGPIVALLAAIAVVLLGGVAVVVALGSGDQTVASEPDSGPSPEGDDAPMTVPSEAAATATAEAPAASAEPVVEPVYGVKVSYKGDAVDGFVVEDSLDWDVDLCSTDKELLKPAIADRILFSKGTGDSWVRQRADVSVRPGERCGKDGVHIVIPRTEQAPDESAWGQGWSPCTDYRISIPETSTFARTKLDACVRTRADLP